jgi:hypothetical protein
MINNSIAQIRKKFSGPHALPKTNITLVADVQKMAAAGFDPGPQ